MLSLAVDPQHLSDYLQHTVAGRSMKEIAKLRAGHASTVLRHIRAVEDSRDCPEWNEILTALEEHEIRRSNQNSEVSPEVVAEALGVSLAGVTRRFSEVAPILTRLAVCLVTATDLKKAVIFDGCSDQKVTTFARADLLAAIAFGWLARLEGGASAARRYRITDRALSCASPNPKRPRQSDPRVRPCKFRNGPIDIISRKSSLFGAPEIALAARFQDLHAMRESVARERWEAFCAAMPPFLLRPLVMVCGEGQGVEVMENELGLPSRSGKAILAAALQTAAHLNLISA